ncbi:PIN domain-containing protein [Microbacterium sp. SA39]|uniref:PIN domain-containing protein n=1 Tax=Microbacterium sp. SA39 TaxID=1263625 RepID=UPI00061FCA4F|nr:PIN domain-containing protein [Microbacterium sp. SA39]KJQ52449.1 Ribonuclease VapC40 [Microbacterium sp. SA39]
MTYESFVLPISADVLLDTSAAVALVDRSHPAHHAVKDATRGLVRGLAGHALVETYSVLTRLPGDARLSPEVAEQVIARAFPASVSLPPEEALGAVATFAAAGIAGGAVYDGLVALAARVAATPLLSCDRRAIPTYAALKVEVRLV